MTKNEKGDSLDGMVGGKNKDHQVYIANVWYSWQKFTGTVQNVLESEWKVKKHDIYTYVSHLCQIFQFISAKDLFISAIPLILYLSVFKSYLVLKEVFNLPEEPHLTLPVYEYLFFRCLPHQILSRRSGVMLDILAAVPYLVHFVLPVFFILYLTIRRRSSSIPLVYQYLWCAGWVNLIAVIIQFVSPTAPPWFNDSAVFDEHGRVISSAPNEAAFQRIDALLGFPCFHSIYGQSPLKYGSFPSLHVAWPTVILFHKPWVGRSFGLLHVIWITWAALYSSHHYLVDAIGGVSLVIVVKLSMDHIWEPFSKRQTEVKRTPIRLTSCSKAV